MGFRQQNEIDIRFIFTFIFIYIYTLITEVKSPLEKVK